MPSNSSRFKTVAMMAGIALVVGAGTACFGVSSSDSDKAKPAAATTSCDGLTGQAKIDCENQKKR